MVDLGVDHSRGKAPVAKHLTDFDQGSASSQHLSGCGVPQDVRTYGRDAGAATGVVQSSAHPFHSQRTRWLAGAEEDCTLSPDGPAVERVVGDCLADLDRQRQTP